MYDLLDFRLISVGLPKYMMFFLRKVNTISLDYTLTCPNLTLQSVLFTSNRIFVVINYVLQSLFLQISMLLRVSEFGCFPRNRSFCDDSQTNMHGNTRNAAICFTHMYICTNNHKEELDKVTVFVDVTPCTWYYSIFTQRKNSGYRETAIAR